MSFFSQHRPGIISNGFPFRRVPEPLTPGNQQIQQKWFQSLAKRTPFPIFEKRLRLMAKKGQIAVSNTEQVTKCDLLTQKTVEERIFTFRGTQVIFDKDIAGFYGVETKRLNEQVKRNPGRFPPEFMFQLTKEEWDSLRSQNATINKRGQFSKYPPYAFTESGVVMLAAVLKSDVAVKASVVVVKAFVAMRRFLVSNAQVFQRLDRIEYKLLESDHKFEDIYSKLEEKSLEPKQGIFFDGQIYDSYKFIISLIKSAIKRIILIDNYIDGTVLTMLDNRALGVDAIIYTLQISPKLQLDIDKHNAQHPAIPIKVFTKAHDRFLIVDNRVYHIGASLKDLGKKWFAFSLMEEADAEELLTRIK